MPGDMNGLGGTTDSQINATYPHVYVVPIIADYRCCVHLLVARFAEFRPRSVRHAA
jgi:hypothetical protein